MTQLGGLDSKQTGYEIKNKNKIISFLCTQCTILMGKIIWGWEGNYEKGTYFFFVGESYLGASTFPEPLSVKQESLRNRKDFLASAW